MCNLSLSIVSVILRRYKGNNPLIKSKLNSLKYTFARIKNVAKARKTLLHWLALFLRDKGPVGKMERLGTSIMI